MDVAKHQGVLVQSLMRKQSSFRGVAFFWGGLFAAMSFLATVSVRAADLPLTRLESLSLHVFGSGQEAETVINGSDLEGVESLWFSDPGITAKWVKDKTFVVRVEPSVLEGAYDVRAVGTHGVSNPRGIIVDRVAAIRKTEPSSVAKPMEVSIGAVISGTATAASRDAYRFEARANQRLTVRCVSREIDSKLVPMIAVIDESGKRVASASRSEELHFVIQRAGRYTVVLHDLTFAGGSDYRYRLSVDESPFLAAAIPAVLQPGQKNRVVFFGRCLPSGRPASEWLGAQGAGWEGQEVEVEAPPAGSVPRGRDGILRPGAAGVETFSYRFRGPSGISNPIHFLLCSGTVVSLHAKGTEGKGSGATMAAVETLPAAFSGVFAKGFQGIGVEWRAKAGEVVWAEVFSQRLGFEATNAFLRLDKENQNRAEAYGPEGNAGGPKLSTVHNDPLLRFEIKEDGLYQLCVSDLSGASRSGLGAGCAVILGREPSKFSLVAVTEPPPESTNDRSAAPRGAVLRSGGTTALRVVAIRGAGFSEAIELEAQNLPPGVLSERTLIPAGKNEGTLILKSNAPLPKGVAEIRIVGRTLNKSFECVARGAVCKANVVDSNLDPAPVRLVRAESTVIGTTPSESPLVLTLEGSSTVEAVVGRKLEVPLKLTRKPEFQVALKVKPGGFAGSETAKETDVPAKSESVKILLDLAALKLGEGRHAVFFTAQAKTKLSGKDVVTTVYSPPVQIEVRQASKPAAAPAAAPASTAPKTL